MKDSILGDLSMYNDLIKSRINRRELFQDRIVDSSPVEWISGLGMYKIVFSKEEIQTFYFPNMPHYIITMDIFDNIGVPIFSIKFTEIDAVAIIMNIVSQLFDIYEFGVDETMSYPLLRMDRNIGSLNDTIFINIAMIKDFPEEIPFGESILFSDLYEQTRELEFSISYYNNIEKRMMKSLSIPVCSTEALNIVDNILCIIGDIELPYEQEEILDCVLYSLDQ